MKKWAKKLAKYMLHRQGVELVSYNPYEITPGEQAIIDSVRPYTMTNPQRIHALIRATQYVANSRIPGDIVECGVWKGGSIMTVASTLLSLGRGDSKLYLFDTFEGMPRPDDVDVNIKGVNADGLFRAQQTGQDSSSWMRVTLEDVKQAVFSTGYDKDKFVFVKGKVEDTLPDRAPETISLLRLDTDFYQSTRHELVHLFPRLSRGGILIIDDYGVWKGSRRAVDEYIEQHDIKLFLNRIDHTARIGVKI